MPDQPSGFLRLARYNGRRVHKIDQGDIVGIEDLQKTIVLVRRIHFKDAAGILGVVGHQPRDFTVESAETGDQVFCVRVLDLKVLAIIHHLFDHMVHIIGLIKCIRNNVHKVPHVPVWIVCFFPLWWSFPEVLREVAEQFAAFLDGHLVVVAHHVAGSAQLHVVVRSTNGSVDFFRGGRLGLARAAEPHVSRDTAHEQEIA